LENHSPKTDLEKYPSKTSRKKIPQKPPSRKHPPKNTASFKNIHQKTPLEDKSSSLTNSGF